MAGKAKAKEDLAKAGVEVTEGMLKSLLKKAKEAVRKGANSSKVEKIVESAGNGKSAYLKAEKKVLDVLTGTKRSDTGAVLGKTKKVTLKDGTTINVKKDFRSNKDVEAGTGRRILKGAIRTSPLTGTGVAVGISATKRKKAEDARKAAADSAKNRKRSDAAEEEYKATRGGAAKRQAARDKKAAAATTKKKSGTTKTTTKGKGKLFPKFRPFGGVLARALLGDDENFGGERGAIDFIRTKKKNMGGMMKKKGYADGGAMKKKGYSKGGAMKKKGYAMGGMAKKGYANGGPAKKTTAKKTSSRGKARGVGAATRGYGATMK